ncbi:MAG: pro-sigmaK processing inhibitor BofA family protein [Clostridia bacterium]|nr:pro-sigmaK processing inhibitor BofA family protein [Clostridia bacterium]
MNYSDLLLIAAGICLSAVCLFLFRKSGRFFASLFLSAVSGIGGIIAVNLLSDFTSVAVPVNPVSLAFGGMTGLSGVISLVLWQIIFTV